MKCPHCNQEMQLTGHEAGFKVLVCDDCNSRWLERARHRMPRRSKRSGRKTPMRGMRLATAARAW
jgi:DNA-directed RNA polymerase subunit RPC12/RpoP